MTVTAGTMFSDSLELLGVYDPGEPLTAADAQRCMNTSRQMLDSWSNESLTCYAILEQSAPLVPGQQSYTIGPGGNFNMTRPLRIIGAPGSVYVQDSNGNNYGVNVVSRAQWNMIGNRDASVVTSNFPDTLFYDPQFPLGVMNFNPTPSSSYTAFWDSYLQLVDFTSLSDPLNLPPGYELAIVTNLALMLKPFYLDAQLDPAVVAQASASKANIKRTNTRRQVSIYDQAIVSRTGVSWNVYTDRTGSTSGAP